MIALALVAMLAAVPIATQPPAHAVSPRFIRMRLAVDEFGMHGTGVLIFDRVTGRYVRRFDVGPASDSEGFDGTRAWAADAANTPYIQGNADTRATIRAWSSLIVRAVPAKVENEVDVTYDAQSRHISRMRVPVAGNWYEVRLSDYRRIADGPALPYSIEINDLAGKRFARVTSVDEPARVDDARFVPPSPPNDATMLDGASLTTVPLLTSIPLLPAAKVLPIVKVRINNSRPMNFLLDTGGQNILSLEAAKQLALPRYGTARVGGVGADTSTYSFAWVDHVRVGNAEMRHQPFMILALNDLLPGVDGIIGAEFLSRFVVRLDYERGAMAIARNAPESWFAKSTAVPMTFDVEMPQVVGAVGTIHGDFTIDTGAVHSFDINSAFAKAHRLLPAHRNGAGSVRITGVGGTIHAVPIMLPIVYLGALEVWNVSATATDATAGVAADPSIAANIGERLLRRFSVVLDYRNERIVFKSR